MFHIVLCDDDIKCIEKMKEMIKKSNDENIEMTFHEFYSGEDLLKGDMSDADVIFLDIQMKGLNGNQVAYRLKEKGYRGLLIQCSEYFAPTTETVVISPYRYIQKNDSEEKNLFVFKEILKEMVRRHDFGTIEVESGKQIINIKVGSIVYIERDRKGSRVVLDKHHVYADKTLIIRKKPEELIDSLREAGFAFPHNRYLVNLNYLEKISFEDNTIKVAGEIFNIARSKKEEFVKAVTHHFNSKY